MLLQNVVRTWLSCLILDKEALRFIFDIITFLAEMALSKDHIHDMAKQAPKLKFMIGNEQNEMNC
jgi:hypothetical protein